MALLLLLGRAYGGASDRPFSQHLAATGDNPGNVVAWDFDGDGVDEFVAPALFGGEALVVSGLVAGVASYQRIQADQGFAARVLVADLNADGLGDVVIAHRGAGVSVRLGTAPGVFGAETFYEVLGTPSEPNPFTVDLDTRDFNGDGVLDLIVGSTYRLGLFLGNGDGTFADAIWLLRPGGTCRIVAGDFNGDGLEDFIESSTFAGVRLWSGNGDGTFQMGTGLGIACDLEVSDVNGDGVEDIVAATFGQLFVHLGLGGGEFAPRVAYATGFGVAEWKWLALPDLNGDGNADVVIASVESDDLFVRMSLGDGTLSPAVRQPVPFTGGPLLAGDFDRDGHQDVAMASYLGRTGATVEKSGFFALQVRMMAVLSGDGSGGLGSGRGLRSGVGSIPGEIAATDFDNDDRLDLAAGSTGESVVSIAIGAGDGSFNTTTELALAAPASSVAASDFNGDGFIDVAATSEEIAEVQLHLGAGNGTFAPGAGLGLSSVPIRVVAADLDGDGVSDLATVHEATDEIQLHHGRGDGTFEAAIVLSVGDQPFRAEVVDLDRAHGLDLVVANRGSDDGSVLLALSGRSYGPENRYDPQVGHLQSLGSGDANGDGLTDLLFGGILDPALAILASDGEGGLVPHQRLEVPTFPRDIRLADLNGDGLNDIVVSSIFAFFGLFLGTPTGFGPATLHPSGAGGSGLAIEDFDRDGLLDVVVSDEGLRVLTLLNELPVQIRFDTKTRLRWPALVGYTSFNVYRGPMSDLQDPDGDGLADGGYGACVTAADPDPSDNLFEVDDDPLPGEGYFYLMSRVRNGEAPSETGLGANSSGQPRAPTSPCRLLTSGPMTPLFSGVGPTWVLP